jgi:hypothetical protein
MSNGMIEAVMQDRGPGGARGPRVVASSASQEAVGASALLRRGQAALAILTEARQFAQELRRNIWDFSVEIATLQELGLTTNDLRWLVCKGFVQHACETTAEQDDRRVFKPEIALAFSPRSCCVLTDAGAEFLSSTATPLGFRQELPTAGHGDRTNGAPVRPLPKWDRDRQELRVGKLVVKQFSRRQTINYRNGGVFWGWIS